MMPKNIKTPSPLRSVEREFSSEMVKMVDQISKRFKNQVFDEMNKGTIEKFADAQIGNFAVIFLKLVKNVKNKLFRQYSDDRIQNLVDQTTGKINRRNQKLLYEAVEKEIGIDTRVLIKEEGISSTINAFRIETEVWVQRLRNKTLEDFTANSLRVMSEGGSLSDVLIEFNDNVDKSKKNARMMARTQTSTFNSLLTKVRAQKLGITKAVWETSLDERTRKCHAARQGKEFDLSEGLYSSCDGKILLPGTDWNCRCTCTLIISDDE